MTVWDTHERAQRPPYSHPLLAELIFALDRHLRRHCGVFEYSAHPACMFRIEICCSRRHLVLRDGTGLRQTDRVARLHCWNEHVPSTQHYANRVDWAREVCSRISRSLDELARYLNGRPDLRDVNVVCADVTSAVRGQRGQISHIMERYGFETIDEPEPWPPRERIRLVGENILISMMVFAQNADTLRMDTLRRVRVPVCVSRCELERRFEIA